MRRGVTILEILVVVIIIGIIAAISVFTNTERDRGREGETVLGLIHQAEKRYSMDNSGVYYTCSPGCTKALIQQYLGIDIHAVYFTYSIAKRTTTAGFRATATRIGTGNCATKTMTVSDLSGQVQKGCSLW